MARWHARYTNKAKIQLKADWLCYYTHNQTIYLHYSIETKRGDRATQKIKLEEFCLALCCVLTGPFPMEQVDITCLREPLLAQSPDAAAPGAAGYSGLLKTASGDRATKEVMYRRRPGKCF